MSLAPRQSWFPRLHDSDLAHLHRLHRVVKLNLAESDAFTDKGLAALRGLDVLSELCLDRLNRYRHPEFNNNMMPLTEKCLVHLQKLPRLEELSLAGNLITDQGLGEIARMTTLKSLDLTATEITDAGLERPSKG